MIVRRCGSPRSTKYCRAIFNPPPLAATQEITVRTPAGRVCDEPVGEPLRHVGREEGRVRIGELIELGVQGRTHRRVPVAKARHRRTARGIEISATLRVGELEAAATHGDQQRSGDLAVQDMGHAAARGRQWTLNAASWASVRLSAFATLAPSRPAVSVARISPSANAGAIVWKNEGLPVVTNSA